MDNQKFIKDAHLIVANYIINDLGLEDFDKDDIHTVWVSKVLQNNKGLFSTLRKDGRYYEVTYNGDKKEFYLDAYKKEKNMVIPVSVPYKSK